MDLYNRLKTLLEISNSDTSNYKSIKEIEKSILTSFDAYGVHSKQEKDIILQTYSHFDNMLNDLGVKEFNENARLISAYEKIAKLDEETFFEKGAFTALRKLRAELWKSLEHSETTS
jgi:hypothetical protein